MRSFIRKDLIALLQQPDRPLTAPEAEPTKKGPDSFVVKTRINLDGKPTSIAFKRSRYQAWHKALLGVWRRSRALRAWHLGHALRERGIDTARPLFVCEPRKGWLRWESYLATEWIDGVHLHEYAHRIIAGPAERSAERRRAECAVVVGRLLGRMHAWNVAHRDLKAFNLMMAICDRRLHAHLIDFDGVRMLRRLSERRRARNLARLATSMEAHPWVTRTDRLRFLRAYIAVAPLDKHNWKWFWRQAAKRSRRLTSEMRASGREVL